MDIYSILSSKPHNHLFLKRYITFIEQCQQKNVDYEGYVERHHICPKAKDMFPEYKDFRLHSWNCAILTARQHFIAHIMLWKCFSNTVSCKDSLWFMSNGKWKQYSNYSKTYESLRTELLPKWIERGKQLRNTSVGKAVVKDSNGNIFKVLVDDSRLKNGEIVGVTAGTVTIRDSDKNTFYRISKEEFDAGDFEGTTKGIVSAITADCNHISVTQEEFESRDDLFGVCKDKVPCKDKTGNMYHLTKEEFYSRDDLFSIFSGMVVCKDKTGNMYHLTKEEFYSRDDLSHHRKGMIACKDINGNKLHVTQEEFRKRDDLVSYSGNMVHCFDEHDNKITVTKEEFKQRDDLISLSKYRFLNKIKCVNTETGKKVWLTQEEFDNKPTNVIKFAEEAKVKKNTKNLVRARDLNGNIVTVTREEFKQRGDLVGSSKGIKSKNMERLLCRNCNKSIAKNRIKAHEDSYMRED